MTTQTNPTGRLTASKAPEARNAHHTRREGVRLANATVTAAKAIPAEISTPLGLNVAAKNNVIGERAARRPTSTHRPLVTAKATPSRPAHRSRLTSRPA